MKVDISYNILDEFLLYKISLRILKWVIIFFFLKDYNKSYKGLDALNDKKTFFLDFGFTII